MDRRLFILFLATPLVGCGGEGESATGAGAAETPKTEKANIIAVLGDSIATGYNANTNFPSVIQGQTGLQVINQSRPGQAAEHGASEALQIFQRANPKYLVALLGTNNATGNGAGVDGAINSIRYLARICQENGVIGIFGTLPPIIGDSGADANAAAISAGIRGVGNGARIVDIRAALGPGEMVDRLHPNDHGQRIIGQMFASQVY